MDQMKSGKRLLLASGCIAVGVLLLPHQPWVSVITMVVGLGLLIWDNIVFKREQREYELESDARLAELQRHCTTPPRGEEED